MKKKLLLLPVIVALLAFGVFALLFRPAKGAEIDRRMEAQVDTWQQAQAARPTEITGEETGPYPELKAAMEAYNREIYENGQEALKDSHSYTEELIDLESYGITDGIVGVISVPSVGVSMPLFLGASTDNLAKGFAQLSYTSMPVGGENTACVAAAHRGWDSGKYFRDAEAVQIGDTVELQNLWETLTYRVTEIRVIDPDDSDAILIQAGRDLLILFTCTPYGLPIHRLLIICERVQ